LTNTLQFYFPLLFLRFLKVSDMLSSIASAAAAKSSIPLQAEALSELENALEGVLENVFVAAFAYAKSDGRTVIDAKDIQAVHNKIMKNSKKN
jgi:histone H3/H4